MARVITAVLVIVLALALVEAKIMLQRTTVPPNFVKLGRADPNMMFDFRVALKQRNLDVLEATLLDVADPDSPNYAKWWTTEQILDLIAPTKDAIRPVVAWLKAGGIEKIDVSGRDFIKAVAPINVIEQLFQTEFYNYQYQPTGKIVARIFGGVHVPEHLEIIDMIFGLTELIKPSSINPQYKVIKELSTQQDLGYIYPGILRKMYGLPSKYWVSPKSSICVAEFQDDASFNKQDLVDFNKGMNEKIHVDKIVGPYSGDSPDGESTLDVQYGSAIALNTSFWFWTVDRWMYEFATQLFNAKAFPLVVSMSWGWPEDKQCDIIGCSTVASSYAYVAKVNTEFLKIGLKGVTLLAASGDQGAPGDEDTSCQGTISTIFPGASPWVTSVGATMLVSPSATESKRQAGQPPVCQTVQCATTTTEGVCTFPIALITTGGGFSDVSTMPGWQKDVVNKYLNSGVTFPLGNFNASNRGFPDVSANGHNYLIQMSGQGFVQVDGTSASSPVFAAVISILNSYLMDKGKGPIGFANPLLYKMYAADKTTFTDITTGNNYCTESCCGNVGYIATKGWDAVTGLGTPNFPKMQAFLQKNVVDK